MNSLKNIEKIIDKFPKGYVFTSNDFNISVSDKQALIKRLNRLAQNEKLSKLSKGRFYKPERTPFGELEPKQYQIVKDLLVIGGKTVGYLTGYSIYNQLGLTTQVSNLIQIGKNEIRPAFKRANYKISIIKQKNSITKENIPLLQILDSIKYIKKIPDSNADFIINRLKILLKDMSVNEIIRIIKLSMKYPPSTRALLGAILDNIGFEKRTDELLTSLNSITKYSLPNADKVLLNIEKWNIE